MKKPRLKASSRSYFFSFINFHLFITYIFPDYILPQLDSIRSPIGSSVRSIFFFTLTCCPQAFVKKKLCFYLIIHYERLMDFYILKPNLFRFLTTSVAGVSELYSLRPSLLPRVLFPSRLLHGWPIVFVVLGSFFKVRRLSR